MSKLIKKALSPYIVGPLAGATIGAGAGLLFGPKNREFATKENVKRLLRNIILGGGVGLGLTAMGDGGSRIIDALTKGASVKKKANKSRLLAKLVKKAAGNDFWSGPNANYAIAGGTGLLSSLLLYHFLNDEKKRNLGGYLSSGLLGLGGGLLGAGLHNNRVHGKLWNSPAGNNQETSTQTQSGKNSSEQVYGPQLPPTEDILKGQGFTNITPRTPPEGATLEGGTFVDATDQKGTIHKIVIGGNGVITDLTDHQKVLTPNPQFKSFNNIHGITELFFPESILNYTFWNNVRGTEAAEQNVEEEDPGILTKLWNNTGYGELVLGLGGTGSALGFAHSALKNKPWSFPTQEILNEQAKRGKPFVVKHPIISAVLGANPIGTPLIPGFSIGNALGNKFFKGRGLPQEIVNQIRRVNPDSLGVENDVPANRNGETYSREKLLEAEKNARILENVLQQGNNNQNKRLVKYVQRARAYANKLWEGHSFGSMPDTLAESLLQEINAQRTSVPGKAPLTKANLAGYVYNGSTSLGGLEKAYDLLEEYSSQNGNSSLFREPRNLQALQDAYHLLPKEERVLVDQLNSIYNEWSPNNLSNRFANNAPNATQLQQAISEFNAASPADRPQKFKTIQDIINDSTLRTAQTPQFKTTLEGGLPTNIGGITGTILNDLAQKVNTAQQNLNDVENFAKKTGDKSPRTAEYLKQLRESLQNAQQAYTAAVNNIRGKRYNTVFPGLMQTNPELSEVIIPDNPDVRVKLEDALRTYASNKTGWFNQGDTLQTLIENFDNLPEEIQNRVQRQQFINANVPDFPQNYENSKAQKIKDATDAFIDTPTKENFDALKKAVSDYQTPFRNPEGQTFGNLGFNYLQNYKYTSDSKIRNALDYIDKMYNSRGGSNPTLLTPEDVALFESVKDYIPANIKAQLVEYISRDQPVQSSGVNPQFRQTRNSEAASLVEAVDSLATKTMFDNSPQVTTAYKEALKELYRRFPQAKPSVIQQFISHKKPDYELDPTVETKNLLAKYKGKMPDSLYTTLENNLNFVEFNKGTMIPAEYNARRAWVIRNALNRWETTDPESFAREVGSASQPIISQNQGQEIDWRRQPDFNTQKTDLYNNALFTALDSDVDLLIKDDLREELSKIEANAHNYSTIEEYQRALSNVISSATNRKWYEGNHGRKFINDRLNSIFNNYMRIESKLPPEVQQSIADKFAKLQNMSNFSTNDDFVRAALDLEQTIRFNTPTEGQPRTGTPEQQPKPKRDRTGKTFEETAREMYADYDAERGLGIRPDGTYGIVDAVKATEYQQKLETEKAEAEKALETAKGKSAKTWTERLKVIKENIRKMNYHFKKFRRG